MPSQYAVVSKALHSSVVERLKRLPASIFSISKISVFSLVEVVPAWAGTAMHKTEPGTINRTMVQTTPTKNPASDPSKSTLFQKGSRHVCVQTVFPLHFSHCLPLLHLAVPDWPARFQCVALVQALANSVSLRHGAPQEVKQLNMSTFSL